MMANAHRVDHSKPKVHKAHPHPKRRPVHYSHHSHTAKRLPFHQTSYALLFFVLLFTTGCLLFVRQATVNGATEQGDVQLSGLVPGPPPSVPVVIQQPTDNQRFTSSTQTVTGTCDHDYIVELYRNTVLAGSVVCTPTGTFSLMITLVPGQNDLIAKTRDIVNQYGPDSTTITVFYDVPVPPDDGTDGGGSSSSGGDNEPTTPTSSSSVVIGSQGYFRVDQASKTVRLNFTITGGQAPYRFIVRWGDGEQTTYTYTKSGEYQLSHTYKQPGQYRVVLDVRDANEARAVFQTVVIVDGVTEVNLSTSGTLTQRCQLDAVCIFQNQIVDGVNRTWPIFMGVSIMTLCFWFGEKVALTALTKKSTR